MLLRGFLHRPQSVFARRALFQVHLWVGVVIALYVLVIGVTGAAVVFRPELQAATFPRFFEVDRSGGQPEIEAPAVLNALESAYPDHSLAGIDWPTYRRQTFLAYLAKDGTLKTVFVHPLTADVLGELKDESWTRVLQELHFNLLGGRTGAIVNGVGALCLLVMCVTGLIIWWPGVDRWRQSLGIDLRASWRRINWSLHGAVGFWSWLLILMWAVTGTYFVWSQPVRQAVNAVLPLTKQRNPESNPALEGKQPPPNPAALIATARYVLPGAKMARFIPPSGPRGTYLVLMARDVHGDFDNSDEVSMYFDRYTGGLLQTRDNRRRTSGDVVMAWLGPLHVGSFGGVGVSGTAVKVVWALTALSFPILAVTGLIMWWSRVLSEQWARLRSSPARSIPAG